MTNEREGRRGFLAMSTRASDYRRSRGVDKKLFTFDTLYYLCQKSIIGH